MQVKKFVFTDRGVEAAVSVCRPSADGGAEYNLTIRPLVYASAREQVEMVRDAYLRVLEELGVSPETAVFRRFFCSDLVNQRPELDAVDISSAERAGCAISLIEQPPLPDCKVAMWAYHVADATGRESGDRSYDGRTLSLRRNGRTHLWSTRLVDHATESSYNQTFAILSSYVDQLDGLGLALKDDTIRTWIFVQNVDGNYGGLVRARREFFEEHGLTKYTHYIASTGIEGGFDNPHVKVTMDIYSVAGLEPGQVSFLHALSHLNPTHEYGVTFERGTRVDYGDRRHLFISGTASIDKRGEVVHVGDVRRQTARALENIGALLADGEADFEHVTHFIVYLRDHSDHALVRGILEERFGDVPTVFVVAPVCRPGWLVELECLAVVPQERPEFAPF